MSYINKNYFNSRLNVKYNSYFRRGLKLQRFSEPRGKTIKNFLLQIGKLVIKFERK